MKKEILPLTSLRFVAAIYVFLFHMEIYWHIVESGGLAQFFMKGSCGMSLFFILSGFVLSYRFHQGVKDYKNYALSRFTRIYPAYFLAGLVTFPWLISSLTAEGSNSIPQYLFIIFSNIFMIQAWIPKLFTFWNDNGSWSLSVEMFFYALFPMIINHCKHLNNKQLCILLVIVYATTSIPGLSWILFSKGADHLIFYSIPIFRVSEFIIGIACGLFFAKGIRMPYPAFLALLSGAGLYSYLAYGPTFGYAGMAQNFVAVPLLTLITFSTASLSSGWLYQLMCHNIFVYLGRISYSFYSFQVFMLLLLMSNHETIVRHFPLMAKGKVLAFFTLMSLLIISALSYYLIENKCRHYLNRWFEKRALKAADTREILIAHPSQ